MAASYVDKMDPEEDETVYANDETRDLINVSELLKTHSLEELLQENRKEIKEKEIQNEWFHGRIARDAAEEILKKGAEFGFLMQNCKISIGNAHGYCMTMLSLVPQVLQTHLDICTWIAQSVKRSHLNWLSISHY